VQLWCWVIVQLDPHAHAPALGFSIRSVGVLPLGHATVRSAKYATRLHPFGVASHAVVVSGALSASQLRASGAPWGGASAAWLASLVSVVCPPPISLVPLVERPHAAIATQPAAATKLRMTER
jgi:hypothetical protein